MLIKEKKITERDCCGSGEKPFKYKEIGLGNDNEAIVFSCKQKIQHKRRFQEEVVWQFPVRLQVFPS